MRNSNNKYEGYSKPIEMVSFNIKTSAFIHTAQKYTSLIHLQTFQTYLYCQLKVLIKSMDSSSGNVCHVVNEVSMDSPQFEKEITKE